MGIIVVSLPCTTYQCGALIALLKKAEIPKRAVITYLIRVIAYKKFV